jgi:hypothetical protein
MRLPKRISGRIGHRVLRGFRRSLTVLFDPYRPELHYMRGPGPKWRERQALLVAHHVYR